MDDVFKLIYGKKPTDVDSLQESEYVTKDQGEKNVIPIADKDLTDEDFSFISDLTKPKKNGDDQETFQPASIQPLFVQRQPQIADGPQPVVKLHIDLSNIKVKEFNKTFVVQAKSSDRSNLMGDNKQR